jgi:hypothetical protein
VERQHGSSEKESPAQGKQSGPQRFSAQGSAHARAEEGSPQGRAQAQVARLETINTEKPAISPAFLHHRA